MAGKAVLKKVFDYFGSLDSGTEEKSAPAISPSSWPLDLFTSPTVAGPSVTASTALRVPAVLQAVRLIAETVGSLPVKAYRGTDDGKEVAKDHPAYRIVHNRANDWTSAGELRMALTLDALLHGHGFARVVRYDDGRPFELHRLDPSKVSLRVDSVTGAPIYLVSEEAGQKLYSYLDVLHVSAFGGVAPIVLGKEAIGVAMTLERHAGQFFGNHARPSAVLTKEGKAGAGPDGGATTIKNIRAAWNAVFGPGQSGGPLFLDDGWKYEAATMTSTDAQFVENRVFQIGEIARVFGIPPHLLFELSRATWSNAEQMFDSFLALALRPWLDRWQDAYNTVLFAEDERDDHYTEFVVDDLARADLSARTDAFGKLIGARVMTPNEARAAMNYPAMEGGDELANPYITATTTGPAPAPDKNKP